VPAGIRRRGTTGCRRPEVLVLQSSRRRRSENGEVLLSSEITPATSVARSGEFSAAPILPIGIPLSPAAETGATASSRADTRPPGSTWTLTVTLASSGRSRDGYQASPPGRSRSEAFSPTGTRSSRDRVNFGILRLGT